MLRVVADLLPLLGLAAPTPAQLAIEQPGSVETLPHPLHWFWVGDPLLRRLALLEEIRAAGG